MKKLKIYISIAVIVLITAFLSKTCKIKLNVAENEKRGVYISYIEYLKYFKNQSEDIIKQQINHMIETIKDYNLNMILLQVRPFSDAIYKSEIYPMSYTITGEEGKEIKLDILEYFIKKAHEENIEIHAWINPYRIRNKTDTTSISEKNPCQKWLGTTKVKIIEGKGIYYNPASEEVISLVVSGVQEIIKNYDVDGIHFDDYFYPDTTIDLEEYKEFENTISITDFHFSKTNELIQRVYQTIKEENPNIQFGISPDGNMKNNYDTHYADVKRWLKEDGYIDYIMPQIYYGFYHETKPFIETVNEWHSYIENDVDIIPALALYKSGTTDAYAKTGSEEWKKKNDIISREVLVLRNTLNNDGFSIFRYDFLESDTENKNLLEERRLLKELLKD